jgi:Ca-activated chloride channel family protein
MKTKIMQLLSAIAIIATIAFTGCAKKATPREEPTATALTVRPDTHRTTVEVEKEVVVTKVVEKESGQHTKPRPTPTPLPMPTASPIPSGVPVVPVYGGEELPNGEEFDSMFFEHEGVNPFIDTEDDHYSTFAMDVDTASYTIARRYVNEGHLPPKEAVRVEEFVNYFDLAYPGPREDEGAFAIHLEGAPSPFGGEGYYLVQVGIQGKRIHVEDRKDAVLTFVIDVSGSMDRENRLHLVKRSLLYLVDQLRPTDKVGIVAYGSRAYYVLRPTYASDKVRILDAIDTLRAGGSTYAEAGLREGYRMAYNAFEEGAINRVILCSDGVANVGRTGPEEILQVIGEYAEEGITLSSIGVGLGNYNDVLMEELADKGNGNYAYVDTIEEARRVFVENLTGTLQVIAKDSKIQVDLNPEVVARYRLLGYENRDVADEDFRNDEVDAGEVGAGHSVTALYEIKFQKGVDPTRWVDRALTVHVRYQDPDSDHVHEVAREFWTDEFYRDWRHSSPAFLLTAAVAEYAELLRGSYWAREGSLDQVLALAQIAGTELNEDEAIGADVSEFIGLVARAERLWRHG